MGSTPEEVEECVQYWGGRLVDPAYAPLFRAWITKEVPRHDVPIGPLTASEYPVTNGEYRVFAEATGRPLPESVAAGLPDAHPAWGMGLGGAEAYARWRAAREGVPWRLPTEAEWEWMAAGPARCRYPFGDAFDPSRCNTVERGLGATTPVDAHPRGVSWCGAMDLAGNVEEWTSSRYAPYPGGVFVEDELTRLAGADYPVVRGGCFALGGDLARSSRRHGPHPGGVFRYIGFRLVADAAGTAP